VGALGGTANVRAEHDVVLGFSVEILEVNSGGTNLEVPTAAVNVLLVLDCVLNDQILALVGELRVACSSGIKAGILGCLQTSVTLRIPIVLAWRGNKLSVVRRVLGLHPSALPSRSKLL
jgi:hypothetical protein